MDQLAINELSAAEAEQYKVLESLFAHPGWAKIVKWAEAEQAQQTARQLNAKNWEDNRVAYGAAAAFARLQNLQEATEHEFEALAIARRAERIDEDERRFE